MKLQGVSFRYGWRSPYALYGVSGTVESGDAVGVTGLNGAGKSTLLRIIAGVAHPVHGEIRDRPGNIGYAPQHFPSNQPFTVEQYLTYMAKMRGIREKDNEGDMRHLASRLYCDELLTVPLAELSRGSVQKVSLIQSLIPKPSLLVLDEPFAGIDTATRHEMVQIISELSDVGGLAVVSDHHGHWRDLRRAVQWHLRNGHLTSPDCDASSLKSCPPNGDSNETTTLQVTVPKSEATELATRLRTDGYEVRFSRNA